MPIPLFWRDKNGKAIVPFTEITASDVRSQKYLPHNLHILNYVLDYLDALEKNGRYKLMIWPTHCEIGSWGQNVHIDVKNAYNL